MTVGFLFAIICAVSLYKLGYGQGRHTAWEEATHIINELQHPPGCSCIRNALMPNSACPHHGKSA